MRRASHERARISPRTLSAQRRSQLHPQRWADIIASHRERMLRGLAYDRYSFELIIDREQCALFVKRFNIYTDHFSSLIPEDIMQLFSKIVALGPAGSVNFREPPPRGSIGTQCIVEAPFYCDYRYHLQIGSRVVIGRNCSLFDSQPIVLEDGVTLGPNVVLDCNRYLVDRERSRILPFSRSITIHKSALIQTGAIVSAGVTIGEGSIIEPGSVVCQNVPPWAHVKGNPARYVSQ